MWLPSFGSWGVIVSQSCKVRYAFIFFLTCLLPNYIFGADVSFSSITSSGQASSLHADLNNDGREDFVYDNSNGAGFSVQLSNGDGTYVAPTIYTLPNAYSAGILGIGDFNSDNNADIVVFGMDKTGVYQSLFLYRNNGNGTFTEAANFPVSSNYGWVEGVVVGDFNHDGILDIAFEENSAVTVWFGDGKSNFKVGPSTPVTIYGYLLLGDFDGDGFADLAIGDMINHDTVEVLFGDGTGYFPTQSIFNTPQYSIFGATDVNSDGKTDIVASTYYPHAPNRVEVYYGDSDRNWDNNTIIPIAHCASSAAPVVAADMNGDGINDLVVAETDCGQNGTGYDYVGVLTRNADATYNPDQIVYRSTAPALPMTGPYVLRANLDAKPDIALLQCTTTPCTKLANNEIRVLLNTTSGDFSACAPPIAFEGIHVCSPMLGSMVPSSVPFQLGAAGHVAMRKVEVWVDGEKIGEDLNGFSNYSFFNHSFTMMNGTHHVDIYAAGWDNSLERQSFNLSVR